MHLGIALLIPVLCRGGRTKRTIRKAAAALEVSGRALA